MSKMSSVKVNRYRAALEEKLIELEASVRRWDDIAYEATKPNLFIQVCRPGELLLSGGMSTLDGRNDLF